MPLRLAPVGVVRDAILVTDHWSLVTRLPSRSLREGWSLLRSVGPAKCIDFPVTAHYPKPNANKRASGFSTGSATKANKTVVRCGINIERGQLIHTGDP